MLYQFVLWFTNWLDQHVSGYVHVFFDPVTFFFSRMSLQSALIGYLLSRFLPTPITAQENIVLQTTAVATGTVRIMPTIQYVTNITVQMPLAAGFVGILPALGLLDETRDGVPPVHLSWLSVIGWSCAVAFFGCVTPMSPFYVGPYIFKSVFLSPPLRKQVVSIKQLSFHISSSYLLLDCRGTACVSFRDSNCSTDICFTWTATS